MVAVGRLTPEAGGRYSLTTQPQVRLGLSLTRCGLLCSTGGFLNKALMGWLATAAAAILASPTEAADVTVLNSATQFAEGPVWYHGKLYYVEYDRNTVTTWDGKKNEI